MYVYCMCACLYSFRHHISDLSWDTSTLCQLCNTDVGQVTTLYERDSQFSPAVTKICDPQKISHTTLWQLETWLQVVEVSQLGPATPFVKWRSQVLRIHQILQALEPSGSETNQYARAPQYKFSFSYWKLWKQ